jgi:branched-chain amino acid transport system permease protein
VRRHAPAGICAVLLIAALVLPFYVSQFWEQLGLLSFAAAIGAIGLNLLTGTAGQLSLAHPFFLAVGAYGYCYLAGAPRAGSVAAGTALDGLGLPPLAAMVLAVLLAGVAGLLFSPIARRLRGIALGVASFALIFIGQYVLENATSLTGGTFGRAVPDFSLFGFSFTDANPPLTVLDVPFGRFERLWYLTLVLFVLSYLFARNLRRSRPGRALQGIRDSEVAASVMGVNVHHYKMAAFVISSMYAGLAGVLIGLVFQQVIPDYFSFALAVTYMAMIVIGGLGSVLGSVIGAGFVTALPLILQQYSGDLGFLAQPGTSGVSATDFANFVYGAAIIGVIVFAPDGLAALGRRADRAKPGVPGLAGPASARDGTGVSEPS